MEPPEESWASLSSSSQRALGDPAVHQAGQTRQLQLQRRCPSAGKWGPDDNGQPYCLGIGVLSCTFSLVTLGSQRQVRQNEKTDALGQAQLAAPQLGGAIPSLGPAPKVATRRPSTPPPWLAISEGSVGGVLSLQVCSALTCLYQPAGTGALAGPGGAGVTGET